ncbi:hypothetical protein BJX61DRAFT_513717 [Aspergillus egyptiacus]|nr:hypothetical protein BJX61DRAFT_513717 [Aspergillus egyptiacus]
MAASIVTSGSKAAALYPHARPQVKIDLDGQTATTYTTYTTGDRVEGTVTITASHLISFDQVDIKLEGSQTVTVERGTVPGRAGATQTFLRLRQPIDDDSYPTPRVLEPGCTYRFPFTFVVPQRLLPHICSHQKTNAHVERSHTLLIPSLGDRDDMSPDGARVTYQIRAEVIQKPVVGSPKCLKDAQKKIRIVPAIEEEPPLNVLDNDPLYRTRREKDVKRGLMRPRQGRLVAAASQPKPLQLCPGSQSENPVSTAATIHLRFDPVGEEEPPSLGTVWSKLRVATYYAVSAWQDYPNSSMAPVTEMCDQGMYDKTVPLSTLCVAGAQWTKQLSNSVIRRDSVQSTSSAESITGPSVCFAGNTYYTAALTVPVTLPTGKAFVPTFHSCLISRFHVLELCLSYHTSNMNILTPTISLKLPIQITSAPSKALDSSEREEITQEQVDAEFFRPRNVAPPVFDPVATPPVYSEYTQFPVRSNPLAETRPQEVQV